MKCAGVYLWNPWSFSGAITYAHTRGVAEFSKGNLHARARRQEWRDFVRGIYVHAHTRAKLRDTNTTGDVVGGFW